MVGHVDMTYPVTAEEWWELADKHWDDFLAILRQYLPMQDVVQLTRIRSGEGITIVEDIEWCKRHKNTYLARYFERAWAAAPDSPEIHSNPSWAEFCDMCSESGILSE